MGKEAEGNQVCLVRKKYDATKLSYLTAEVKEDYVELIIGLILLRDFFTM